MAEDEKTIEEVEAEYKAELQSRTKAMTAKREADEIAANAVKAKEEADRIEADKLDDKENLKKEFAELYGLKPKEDVDDLDDAEGSREGERNKHAKFHDTFTKVNDIKRIEYGSLTFLAGDTGFAFTESEHLCKDDISAWSPEDIYCDLIWHAAQCGKQLAGIITVRGCDISKGDGLSVQIRTINADTALTNADALDPCECASCVSNIFSTHTLTLRRFDIYKRVCELDLWDAGDVVKTAMITAMSRAFISSIDGMIWAALLGAVPGYTETGGATFDCDPTSYSASNPSCCMYGANLYKEIIELEARMRAAGYGAGGFYVIMNPRVATYLKYKEGVNPPPWVNNIVMEGNVLTKIGDIKVIEYCGAPICTNLSGATLVIMIDPERAVGEAYGKKPILKSDEDPIECDVTKLVMRSYVAIAALDTGAIGHIINP